jgi:hypothetical protein
MSETAFDEDGLSVESGLSTLKELMDDDLECDLRFVEFLASHSLRNADGWDTLSKDFPLDDDYCLVGQELAFLDDDDELDGNTLTEIVLVHPELGERSIFLIGTGEEGSYEVFATMSEARQSVELEGDILEGKALDDAMTAHDARFGN